MNYQIYLFDFYPSGDSQTFLENQSEFIRVNGMSKFADNMKNRWVWNVNGYDNHSSDGEAVFIKFN